MFINSIKWYITLNMSYSLGYDPSDNYIRSYGFIWFILNEMPSRWKNFISPSLGLDFSKEKDVVFFRILWTKSGFFGWSNIDSRGQDEEKKKIKKNKKTFLKL